MNLTEHDNQTINRYRELRERAAKSFSYAYTPFHSPKGASLAFIAAPENEVRLWGGTKGCERVVIRFGDPEEFGYEEDFPIVLLKVSPKQPKYSGELTHRDFLGAVLNLGIERDTVGDIIIKDKTAYIFVLEGIADHVETNLEKVKHTSVICKRTDTIPEGLFSEEKTRTVTVPSLRLDAIISKVFNIPRSEAKEIFSKESVFINGRLIRSPEAQVKENETVSVRGHGRFTFCGQIRSTKKGNIQVMISE